MGTTINAGNRVTAAALDGLPPSLPLTIGNVSGSTSETTIGSFTIPGNDETTAGNGYVGRVFGTCDRAATTNITIRLLTTGPSGTQLGSTGTLALQTGTNLYYSIDFFMLFESVGSTAVLDTDVKFSEALVSGTKASHLDGLTGLTIDNTQAIVIAITGTFSVSNAGNIARTLVGTVHRL